MYMKYNFFLYFLVSLFLKLKYLPWIAVLSWWFFDVYVLEFEKRKGSDVFVLEKFTNIYLRIHAYYTTSHTNSVCYLVWKFRIFGHQRESKIKSYSKQSIMLHSTELNQLIPMEFDKLTLQFNQNRVLWFRVSPRMKAIHSIIDIYLHQFNLTYKSSSSISLSHTHTHIFIQILCVDIIFGLIQLMLCTCIFFDRDIIMHGAQYACK